MFKDKNTNSMLIGLIILIMGTGFLLDSFNLLDFASMLRMFWPLIFIVFSLQRFSVKDWKGGVILGVIGIIAQLTALEVIKVNFWAIFWPMILIGIGFSILLKTFSKTENTDSKSSLNESIFFGGLERNITSTTFSGGSITTLFGGSKINLSHAKLADEGADLDLFVMFGGAEIIVPEDVKVVMDVTVILGGNEDKRSRMPAEQSSAKTLTIKGFVGFGGIEIKN
jgi:predicted membrane protein